MSEATVVEAQDDPFDLPEYTSGSTESDQSEAETPSKKKQLKKRHSSAETQKKTFYVLTQTPVVVAKSRKSTNAPRQGSLAIDLLVRNTNELIDEKIRSPPTSPRRSNEEEEEVWNDANSDSSPEDKTRTDFKAPLSLATREERHERIRIAHLSIPDHYLIINEKIVNALREKRPYVMLTCFILCHGRFLHYSETSPYELSRHNDHEAQRVTIDDLFVAMIALEQDFERFRDVCAYLKTGHGNQNLMSDGRPHPWHYVIYRRQIEVENPFRTDSLWDFFTPRKKRATYYSIIVNLARSSELLFGSVQDT
jgi:hypothetical protein